MWRHVRPGGRLAITSWGETVFEPLGPLFWDAVGRVAPALLPPEGSTTPYDGIKTPTTLAELFVDAGATSPEVELEHTAEPIGAPDEAWTAVLGSGYRGTVEALDEADRARLRGLVVAAVADAGVTQVRSDVLYAVATKPGSASSS
jgi:hypothetical protein